MWLREEKLFSTVHSLLPFPEESGGVRSGPAAPIDPSHPAVVWHPQRWTWVCSRSWGWETGEESTSASVSSVQPPSPAATARPSSPSRWQRDWWSCSDTGTTSGTWQERFQALPPQGSHAGKVQGKPTTQKSGWDTRIHVHPALGSLTLAAASAWSWMMAVTVSGTGWTGVWCWPGAGTGVL